MTIARGREPDRKASVICVGLSALDYTWRVGELPGAQGGKVRALEFAANGGGMAATAAVAVAELGGRASFWGRGGDDVEGRLMRGELAAAGVDVENFRLYPQARSSISGVFVDRNGERQIANFRGADLPSDADWLPLALVRGADVVLADPRWPEGAEAAFAAARVAGVATVLDADVAEPAVFDRLLPLTDHALFSQPALTAFAGSDEAAALDRVESFGCSVAAVTNGDKGVTWLAHGKLDKCPAFAVDVVDTTGAGDVFHGAYALAIALGMDLFVAMGFAAAAAALKCTGAGGRSAIPTFDEVIRLWRRPG